MKNYFPDGNVCVVNGDEFRSMHPKSEEIHRLHEELYAEITDADVRTWTRDVLEHCIQSGYNVVFEGTMRTNAVCDTVARMNSLGYRVVAGIMAVPYHVSFISVYLRYLNELRNTGHGRRVSMESHDAAYQGMPKTVKQLVEDGFCSEFVIFSRVSPDVGASLVAVTQDPLPEIEMARAITQGGDDLSSLNLLCTKIATELTFLGQNKVARSFLHRWRKMKLGIA